MANRRRLSVVMLPWAAMVLRAVKCRSGLMGCRGSGGAGVAGGGVARAVRRAVLRWMGLRLVRRAMGSMAMPLIPMMRAMTGMTG
jgi:hypothetical protein